MRKITPIFRGHNGVNRAERKERWARDVMTGYDCRPVRAKLFANNVVGNQSRHQASSMEFVK